MPAVGKMGFFLTGNGAGAFSKDAAIEWGLPVGSFDQEAGHGNDDNECDDNFCECHLNARFVGFFFQGGSRFLEL